MASSSEDRRDEAAEEMVHKTKAIQFLGRTTPIVLQNDNGPCPLLAICNVLLLKNNMNLSPDIPEVSQEKLLSLVAERLLDSNSNTNNKDAGFVENQQQNISDAIDLLPRLTTGIDVNIKFRRIDDFEFTRECAIFDLLDIPLYHGWIVDPEDSDTAIAIGSKSYNTLTGDLVSLETQNVRSEYKQNPVECIDFAAATTATLGVPSPCLSRGKSFDDSPRSTSNDHTLRKGDLEEEAELLKALKLSETDEDVHGVDTNENENLKKPELSLPDESHVNNDLITFETIPAKADCLASKNEGNGNGLSISEVPDEHIVDKDKVEETNTDVAIKTEAEVSDSSVSEIKTHNPGGDDHVKESSIKSSDALIDFTDLDESKDNKSNDATSDFSRSDATNTESDLSRGKNVNVIEDLTPAGDGSEPLYEGEERILESGTTTYVDREPMYEGEAVLAEQVEKDSKQDAFDTSPKDDITPKQGELIRDFLNNSASQLTVYGLYRLQEGLKERELCVFFRNNHFCTMFKFDGELYLLATDQGYLNQPDLVWEKLNEVNGNTLFMTSNFKEFKVESPTNNTTWDEQNAMVNTTDYLASIDNSSQAQSNFTSDLELAIALQQQEYEQQQIHNVDRPNVSGGSRLVTGPQRGSSTNHPSSTSRQEAKQSKDKCIVM